MSISLEILENASPFPSLVGRRLADAEAFGDLPRLPSSHSASSASEGVDNYGTQGWKLTLPVNEYLERLAPKNPVGSEEYFKELVNFHFNAAVDLPTITRHQLNDPKIPLCKDISEESSFTANEIGRPGSITLSYRKWESILVDYLDHQLQLEFLKMHQSRATSSEQLLRVQSLMNQWE